MDKHRPVVILMVAEPASKSIATVGDSVALVALVVVVVVEVEVTLASTGVVMLVVTTAVVVGVVVSAAVVAVGEVVAFSSETWKVALTVRSLSGCTGRKFPKIGEVSFFFRLRRRLIWQKLIRNE